MKNPITPTPELLAEMDSLQIFGGLTPMSSNDKCSNNNCDCPTTHEGCLVPSNPTCVTFQKQCFCQYYQFCGGTHCLCYNSNS